MADVEDYIIKFLEEEKTKLKQLLTGYDLPYSIVDLIRLVDSHNYYYRFVDSSEQRLDVLEKSRYGWSLFFSYLYKDYTPTDSIPLYTSEPTRVDWTRNILYRCGSIELVHQYLDFTTAGLMTLSMKEHNEFVFEPTQTVSGVEIFEHMSLKYYFELASKVLSPKIQRLKTEFELIKEELQAIVKPFHNNFIQYKASSTIDRYYSELARITLQTTQLYDDFGPEDRFGKAVYSEYLDFVEYSIKAALMHKDAVALLTNITRGAVDPLNNFSYAFPSSKFIDGISEFLGWTVDRASEIVSTLVLDKQNYEDLLSFHGALMPPYIKLGPDILIRSMEGCLTSPVSFLNRQLKINYPKDYFSAVNNREERFRLQLFTIFDNNRMHCVNHTVRIELNSNITDIDAVVFDRKRKILGLFQLKWQDTFSTSMRERWSRISNLYPASIKWIDKIEHWLNCSTPAQILSSCGISESVIDDIYIFVLARNHVHFTGQKLDHRAVWGSWYQLVESISKIKDPLQSNPIGELAVQLSLTYPKMRLKHEDIPESKSSRVTISDHVFIVESKKYR